MKITFRRSARKPFVFAILSVACLAIGSAWAQFTSLTSNVEPWVGGDGTATVSLRSVALMNLSGYYVVIGGERGVFKTTYDYLIWSDYKSSLPFGTNTINTITCIAGEVCAIGGDGPGLVTTTNLTSFSDRTTALGFGTDSVYATGMLAFSSHSYYMIGGANRRLKLTEDFITFSDRSTQLGWGATNAVRVVDGNGCIDATCTNGAWWAIGGDNGNLSIVHTTDMGTFTDRTTALGFGSSTVRAIANNGGLPSTWLIGGDSGKLKYTNNFVTFTDLSTSLSNSGWGGNTIRSIDKDNSTAWRIMGDNGRFVTTTDLINFTDRSTALGFGTKTVYGGTASSNTNWQIVGDNRTFKTTVDGVGFTDYTAIANFNANSINAVYGQDYFLSYWIVGGNNGQLKTSADRTNWSDRTTALGFVNGGQPVTGIGHGYIDTLGGGAEYLICGNPTGTAPQCKRTTNFITYTNVGDKLTFQKNINSIFPLNEIDAQSTWYFVGDNGLIKTSRTLPNMSDRTTAAGSTGYNLYVANGHMLGYTTVVAIGGSSGYLRTTANGTNYSDRTTAAAFGTNAIRAIGNFYNTYNGVQYWAIGGDNGKLKTTKDFISFSDRTTAAGFGSKTIYSIGIDFEDYGNLSGTWFIGASDGTLKTTTDFIGFTDRTSGLAFGNGTDVRAMYVYANQVLIAGESHNLSKEDGVTSLAVKLATFEARPFDSEIQLYWETGEELSNVGFNVYRAAEGDTKWTLLTSQPIQGLNTSATGGRYLFRDIEVQNGVTYHYYLEDIDFFSGGTLHGPVNARPESALGTAPRLSDEELEAYAVVAFSTQFSAMGAPSADRGPPTNPDLETRVSIRSSSSSSTEIELWIAKGTAVRNEDLKDRIEIPSFGQLALPNRPVVPYRGVVLDTACREATQTTVQILSEEAIPGADLEIGSVQDVRDAQGNIVQPWGDGVDPLQADPQGSPGQWATTEDIYPSAYASTGAVRCAGGSHGMATLSVTPLRANRVTHEVTQARHLIIRITWGDSVPSTGPIAESPAQEILAKDRAATKIAINHSGIYRLTPTTPASDLRLITSGVSLPFSGTNEIEFFAEHRPTKQSPETILWLSRDSDLPSKAGDVEIADSGAPAIDLWTTIHAETNRLYITSLPGKDSIDRFIWQATYWAPSFVLQPTVQVPLDHVDQANPADARLRVRIITGNNIATSSPDHHLKIFWNGVEVDDFSVEGIRGVEREILLPHSSLLEGNNSLQVREVGDLASALVVTYLDYGEVEYVRTSTWNGVGTLRLRAKTSGAGEITGLAPNTEFRLWNVTDGLAPKKLTGAATDGFGVLRWDVYPGQEFFVASAPEDVARTWTNTASSLRSQSPTRTLYIAHKDLLPAAERLATYRRAFRDVTVVDVEDIYDEYGDGSVSDLAITTFIQDWKAKRGEDFSVLIFGDATADPHDYLGKGFHNLVPTHLHWIGFFETGSDARLVNGDTGERSAIRVGRIPVLTLAEANAVVDRIISFEASSPDSSWMKKITLAADEPTQPTEQVFEDFSTQTADALPSTFTSEVDLLRVLGTSAMRTKILDSFNDGTLFFNFFGHGAYNFMAQAQVLTAADVTSIHNLDRLPIVTALNCLNGYFVATSVDTLSEVMLKNSTGGAVAYLSSSGLNGADALELFGNGFYRSMTNENPATLGHAFMKEKQRSLDAAGPVMYDTLHLFGDPDLRIPGISPEPQALEETPITDLSTTEDGPTTLDLTPESTPEPTSSKGCNQASQVGWAFFAALALLSVHVSLRGRLRKRSFPRPSAK